MEHEATRIEHFLKKQKEQTTTAQLCDCSFKRSQVQVLKAGKKKKADNCRPSIFYVNINCYGVVTVTEADFGPRVLLTTAATA